MTLEIFLIGLAVVSTLTGLATEAIKAFLEERGKSAYPNALAGITAALLAVFVGAFYIIINEERITAHTAVYLIALVFLSWLSAMVGYDKVVQGISQFKH